MHRGSSTSAVSRTDGNVRTALIVITCLLIAVSFPHALEDFYYGDLTRLGIAVPGGYAILAIAYAIQFLGIALTLRGHAWGPPILGVMGAVWCLGVVFVHGHDLLFAGPAYRHGLRSRGLESMIIVCGMLCAALAVRLRIAAAA